MKSLRGQKEITEVANNLNKACCLPRVQQGSRRFKLRFQPASAHPLLLTNVHSACTMCRVDATEATGSVLLPVLTLG